MAMIHHRPITLLVALVLSMALVAPLACSHAHPLDAGPPAVTLEGTLERREWSKSAESWDADGSEYYVLIGAGTPTPLILRPSEAVRFESFVKFAGRRVVVRGEHVEPTPYRPSEMEQAPSSLHGEPLLRGGGFMVFQIRACTD